MERLGAMPIELAEDIREDAEEAELLVAYFKAKKVPNQAAVALASLTMQHTLARVIWQAAQRAN